MTEYNDYQMGQIVLIKHINDELGKIKSNVQGMDLALDIIGILAKLKPLPKPKK